MRDVDFVGNSAPEEGKAEREASNMKDVSPLRKTSCLVTGSGLACNVVQLHRRAKWCELRAGGLSTEEDRERFKLSLLQFALFAFIETRVTIGEND